jgi:hypothetical protein
MSVEIDTNTKPCHQLVPLEHCRMCNCKKPRLWVGLEVENQIQQWHVELPNSARYGGNMFFRLIL